MAYSEAFTEKLLFPTALNSVGGGRIIITNDKMVDV